MTKNELIEIIVPGTIAQWTVETPQFKHSGKGPQLRSMYSTYNKKDLVKKYDYLKKNGFVQ